jgi:hypothetical protein
MKAIKYLLLGSLVFSGVFAVSIAHAQRKAFAGSVTYEPVHDDRSEVDGMRIPTRVEFIALGTKVRYTEHVDGASRTVISNYETRQQHVLFDFLGQKIALVAPLIDPSEVNPPIIGEEGNLPLDALPIAGYEGKSIRIDDQTVIYSDRFLLRDPSLPAVPGLPLEYTIPKTNARFRAVSISNEIPTDTHFVIPPDYTVVTPEEMQRMFSTSPTEDQ